MNVKSWMRRGPERVHDKSWGEDRNVFTTSHDDDRMHKYCSFIIDNTLIFVFGCSWKLQHFWVVLCCECQLHSKVHWHPNVQYTQKYTNTQMSLHPKVHWHPNVNYTQKYTDTQMSNTPKSTPTPKCQLHPKVHWHTIVNYTQKYSGTPKCQIHPKVL